MIKIALNTEQVLGNSEKFGKLGFYYMARGKHRRIKNHINLKSYVNIRHVSNNH